MSAIAEFTIDAAGAASARHMAEHLTAPFAGGAQEIALEIDASGQVEIAPIGGATLILVSPLQPLDVETLVVATADSSVQSLTFAPYTEAGAELPLAPGVSVESPLTLTVRRIVNETVTAVAPGDIASLISMRLLEGVIGTVLYLFGAEKQRMRRQARELSAQRLLGRAQGPALDQLGADVSVGRFTDIIAFDPGSNEIVTRRRTEADGLEPDDEYRRRIAIYRPLLFPSAMRIDELLNGNADDTTPNSGPLTEMDPTLSERFEVIEQYQPFAIAIRIVATGPAAPAAAARTNLLDYVRITYLVWPLNTSEGNDAHSARLLPTESKQAMTELRTRLRDAFSFTAGAASDPTLAPLLASALDRLARCRTALYAASPAAPSPAKLEITAAQTDDGGSRYELGLGADLTALSDLDVLAAAQPWATSDDPEVQALLSSMTPTAAAADPDGRWLLQPCGLVTVYRTGATTLYVSHLPNFGVNITSIAANDGATAPAPGWALLAGGNFGGPTGHDLFVYDRKSATAQAVAVGVDGELTPHADSLDGLSQDWAVVVTGRFGSGMSDNVLCYDAPAGEVTIVSVSEDGTLEGTQSSGWRKTWSHIVPGNFGGGGTHDDLLFYDQQNGEIEFYSGDLSSLKQLGSTQTGIRRTWSHIQAGQFVAPDTTTSAGSSQVFFYDRDTGLGELYVDGGPAFSAIDSQPDLDSGWSHVETVRFPGSELDQLLFYSTSSGQMELAGVLASGQLRQSASGAWQPGWSHLVPAPWSGSAETDVFAYDRARDRAAFAQLATADGSGVGSLTATVYRVVQIAGIAPATAPDPQSYAAHYNAPETDINVVLAQGLSGTLTAWPDSTEAPFTQLDADDGAAAWDSATPNPQWNSAFASAGIPYMTDPEQLVVSLSSVPADLLTTLQLSPSLSANALEPVAPLSTASDAAATGPALPELVALLRAGGLASVLAFTTTTAAFLVVGAVGLPGVGLNLAERPPTGFRWYSVELAGLPPSVSPQASAVTSLSAADDGLSALVAIAYAASGDGANPYEYRVDLPPGTGLSLLQYEFLMNLLDHAHPAGVGVDTHAIRDAHVELNGTIAPLTPQVWSTFRSFRQPRARGIQGQPVVPSSGTAAVDAWNSLGGQLNGTLVALTAADGHLEIFSVGTAGDLQRLAQLTANGDWGVWESLGSPSTEVSLTGPIAATLNTDGRIALIGAGTDGALWHIDQTSAEGAWGQWASLAGTVAGPVTVALNGDGRIEALVTGADGVISHITQTAAGSHTWSAWQPLAGNGSRGMAIAINLDRRLEVLAVAGDNTISAASQTTPGGPWSAWTPLNGDAGNGLAVAPNADGRLEAFAVPGGASDGVLSHAVQVPAGGTWSEWTPLGGSFGTILAVARNADGRLDAFAAGTDNIIQELAQTSANTTTSWTAPVSLSAEARDLIAVATRADARLEVFVRGTRGDLLHLLQTAPNAPWD